MRYFFLSFFMLSGIVLIMAQDGNNICVYNKISNYNTGGGPTELQEAMKCSDEAITIEALTAKSKTWYYRGQLYTLIFQDTVLRKSNGNAALEAVNAFKKLLEINDPKFKDWSDVGDFLHGLSVNTYNEGVDQFQKYKNYALAYQYFYAIKDINDILKAKGKSLPSTVDVVSSLRNAGFAAENASDTAKAAKAYKEILAITPDTLTYIRYVRLLKNGGRMDEAKQVVNEGLAKYPNSAALRVEKINFFIGLGQFTEALTDVNRLLEIEPRNDGALFIKGLAYDKLGNEDSVVYYYNKTTEANPKYFDAWNNLGALYVNKANTMAEQMNKLGNGAEDSKKYEAMKKQQKELYLKAKPYLEKAIALDPPNKKPEVTQIRSTLKKIELLTAE